MFGRRKEEIQIMNKALEELSNSQKNMELLIENLAETNMQNARNHSDEMAVLNDTVNQLQIAQTNTEKLVSEVTKLSSSYQEQYSEQFDRYHQEIKTLSSLSNSGQENTRTMITEMMDAHKKSEELLVESTQKNTEKLLSEMSNVIAKSNEQNAEKLENVSLQGQDANKALLSELVAAHKNNENYLQSLNELKSDLDRNNDNTLVVKAVLKNLEESQQNNLTLVSAIKDYIDSNIIEAKEELTPEDKERAALALNLCTVSVSQIIDYADINVLEQEYDIILNNLNLEHMPKDEALLNVIKQLLDTITFFRIQDKEREFVEKQYQMNVKNAIWKAIPSPSVIISSGSLPAMGVALAAQIGISFMNYRSEKARINDEKERQEWALQKAAIEQLNGLRRELFDASWRLAEKYDYDEKWRLTENQISQYNQILMDTNSIRKYSRLEAIKQYFNAYPNFLYYFGHAALEVAYDNKDSNVIFSEYIKKARKHFEEYINKYKKNKKLQLLRYDMVASSCALEYIDLLDAKKDKQKILELIKFALDNSGNECDVKQICAIDYLKLGEFEKAKKELKYLVNEGINTVTNSQLLSTIYVHGYIKDHENKHRVEYDLLAKGIIKKSDILFPWPSTSSYKAIGDLELQFINRQRIILKDLYSVVLLKFVERKSIEFNMALPAPKQNKNYPDCFYSDQEDKAKSRRKEYLAVFSLPQEASNLADRLIQSQFAIRYLEVLNDFLNGIDDMLADSIVDKDDILYEMAGSIERILADNASKLNELPGKIKDSKKSEVSNVEKLLDLSFRFFVEDALKILLVRISSHIQSVESLFDISDEENVLHVFCQNNHISIPDILTDVVEDDSRYKDYFEADILGGEAFEQSETNKLIHKMCKNLENEKNSIINYEGQDDKALIYCRFSKITNGDFSNEMKKYAYYSNSVKNNIFAVLLDKRFGFKPPILFSVDGLIVAHRVLDFFFEKVNIIPYDEIQICDNGQALLIGDYKFDSKSINMVNLNDLISKFISMSNQTGDKRTNSKYMLKYQEKAVIGISKNEDDEMD